MNEVTMIALATLALMGGAQTKVHRPAAANQFEVKLSLGKPVNVGQVTLIPIESTAPLAKDEYLTLAEASKMGLVEIVEMPGQQEVNSLEVRNNAKLPILLFAGELLLGGKQDRIVAKDSIVPPKERRDVPVFCVEHGRWDGKPVFASGDTLVPDRIRSVTLSAGAPTGGVQERVWAQVAESNANVSAAPATGTFRGTLNDPKTKAASNRILNSINGRFVPTNRTVGVICIVNGKIESADIYANPSLFRQSRGKLFHSYALDAATAGKSSATYKPEAGEKFLKKIVSARREASDRSKYGNGFTLKGNDVIGLETGTVQFNGGLSRGGGPGGAGRASQGFTHGTYKPKNGG